MNDLTVIAISLSVILLCWAVVRINQKMERTIHKLSRNNDLAKAPDTRE